MEGGASVNRSGTADEAVDAGGLAEEKALQSPNSPFPVDTDPESTDVVFYRHVKFFLNPTALFRQQKGQ